MSQDNQTPARSDAVGRDSCTWLFVAAFRLHKEAETTVSCRGRYLQDSVCERAPGSSQISQFSMVRQKVRRVRERSGMRGGGSRAVFRRIPLPFLPAPPPTVLPIDHRRADVRNTPSQCGRECSCRSASVAPPSRKVVSLHPATFHPVSGPSDARRVHCRAAAPCAPGIRPRAALQVRDCVTLRTHFSSR